MIRLVYFVMNLNLFLIFFDCCVAQQMWVNVAELVDFPIGQNFESIAKLWLSEKKYKLVNIFTSAVLWTQWKVRNDMLFHVVIVQLVLMMM
jgi:hypothetical protein